MTSSLWGATRRPAHFRGFGILLVGIAALLVAACQPAGESGSGSPSASAAAPVTDDEKALYGMGIALSRGVAPLGLDETQLRMLMTGLEDASLGNELQVTTEEAQTLIQAFVQRKQTETASVEKSEGAAFLAAAAAMEGAQTTDSGLVLLVTEAGDGPMPVAASKVRVHYHGTLRDGTVFDSSHSRGEPAEFPLDRVIPCWTEGIQMIPVGSKAVLTCPADIAYGDRGSQTIPPGAALKFEVELLEIVE